MFFPISRLRRMRQTPYVRDLVAETDLSLNDLIIPYFVTFGKKKKVPIDSMPGIFRYSADELVKEVKSIKDLGIRAVLLFGIPETKDDQASSALDDKGPVQNAVREIKKQMPDMTVITDICLCEYTSHGHCGMIINGAVDNDSTLSVLSQMALSHARAGADMVAPSDMMDGRVGAIRQTLDAEGYTNTIILSYSAKYSSAFYGPFREAADSAPRFGDRKTYQMDCRNALEAVREAAQDVEEGADIVMVKPALSYLDIVTRVKNDVKIPVCAYNVSGEYAMVKAAAEKGWIDEKRTVAEILISIRRAGADMIITYHAKEFAEWLKKGQVNI